MAIGALVWVLLALGAQAVGSAGAPARTGEDAPAEQELMESVCARPRRDHHRTFACGTCPAFTSAATRQGPFRLTFAGAGHFSRADATEAVLFMTGCEPRSRGGGGAVLLRRRRARWERVSYHAGFVPTACLTYPGPQQEVLLCEEHDDLTHRVSEVGINAIRYVDDAIRRQKLLGMVDSHGWCGYRNRLFVGRRVDWNKADLDGDGKPDLSLRVEAAADPVKSPGDPCPAELLSAGRAAARTYQLRFLFDGRGFRVAQESAATQKKIADLFPHAH